MNIVQSYHAFKMNSKDMMLKLIKRGFFYVIIGNFTVKFIMFFSSVFLPRFLTKYDYGLLGYIDNILSIIMLANGLGLSNSILRYVSISDEAGKKRAYFTYCLKNGALFNAVAAVLLVIAFVIFPFNNHTNQYLLIMVLIPSCAFLLECIQLLFRGLLNNKYFTVLSISFSFLSASLQILFAILFGLYGVIGARYIAYVFGVALGVFLIVRTKLFQEPLLPLSREEKHDSFKYGVTVFSGNLASLLMPLASTFLVGNLLNTIQLANYKVASLLPQNLEFITSSVMIFAFPYFAKLYKNGAMIKKYYTLVTLFIFCIMVILVPLLYLFTPQLSYLIYGNKYNDTIHVMQMFWITFGVGTVIRTISGNVLAAMGQVRFNLYVNVVSIILTVTCNYFLIKQYGIIGVAYGILLIYFIAGIVNVAYLLFVCKRLMKEAEHE